MLLREDDDDEETRSSFDRVFARPASTLPYPWAQAPVCGGTCVQPMNLCDRDREKCRCFSAIQLPRMYCTVCYQSNLPERKFKKKARQHGSGICLPCQGAVNRHYAGLIGRKRKPGKRVKSQAWDTAVEAARMELCPGYADSMAGLNTAKVAQLAAASTRRAVHGLASKIPFELVRRIESYVFSFCSGPHCRNKPLALLVSKMPETHKNMCHDCKLCTTGVPQWFPRIGEI